MYKVLDTTGYEKLANKYHISSLAAKAMIAHSLSFTNKIKEIDCYEYEMMSQVVGIIYKSINNREKIVIYGDYDVDGICSVSILYRTFKLLNYEVGYYVPNRYEDGYGLNTKRVEQFKEKGYSLIICVDNGIKAFESIELAKKYGMTVVVLDHHQKEENLPNFDAYLHPEYSGFSNYNMCGASVCYYVSKALLNKSDDICLCLAGIATLGDVMPLIDQNKYLVNKSVEFLNKNKYKAINMLKNDNSKYDETVISMQIVPKLNAIGRIHKTSVINKLVKYLTSDNPMEIEMLANFIIESNESRKKLTEEYFSKLDKLEYTNKIIIEKDDDMLEGINGIIASRFANKYNLPSIIFSLDETKLYYKGSARSVGNFNIVELFKDNPYIELYGGHKAAAGLTIKKENYDLFYEKIISDTKDNMYEEPVLEVIEINESELSYKSYLDLLKFSPFGEGNESPLFLIKNFDISRIKTSKDKKHIIINFNNETNLIGFNLVNKIKNDIINYDLIFKLEFNNLFHNKISCKCIEVEESTNAGEDN